MKYRDNMTEQELAELRKEIEALDAAYAGAEEFDKKQEIKKILEDVARYCEDQAIYDKLSKYDDFYYRIIKVLKNNF